MDLMDPRTLAKLAAVLKALDGDSHPKAAKGRKAFKGRQAQAPDKAAREAACLAAFMKDPRFKGMELKPYVNILTYGKVKPDGTVTGWLGQGRRVRPGETGVQVGPFRLFHISQTDVEGAQPQPTQPQAVAAVQPQAAAAQPLPSIASEEDMDRLVEAYAARKAAKAALDSEYGPAA